MVLPVVGAFLPVAAVERSRYLRSYHLRPRKGQIPGREAAPKQALITARAEPGVMSASKHPGRLCNSRADSAGFSVHCPDRSVPATVTDRGDDRPILGHGNGFAKLHAHDGVVGARKGAATTVVTIGGSSANFVIGLRRVKDYPFTEEGEASAAVHLALDHLDLVDVSLHGAGVVGQGQPGGDGLLVAPDAGGE